MAKTKFEKLDLQTKDLTAMNIQKIGALFPNVITEHETEQGEITKAIDFELLQQLLSKELVDGTKEKYQLNWPGKKAALLKANTPITETLRPDIANSKNWDNTENIFIEGDNFTALKILQESYLGKIKMIYIDPPYNTGKDFVYSDKFTIEKSEYAEKIGQYDEENNKLFKENFKTNPRYHSDWLSMMYERLHIARDLLREDGVIFISIDEHEIYNLISICNEIFGEENFIENFIWVKNSTKNLSKTTSTNHEYIVCYTKNKMLIEKNNVFRVQKPGLEEVNQILDEANQNNLGIEETESRLKEFYKSRKDLKGISMYDRVDFVIDDTSGQKYYQLYTLSDISAPKSSGKAATYDVIHPITGRVCKCPTSGWRFTYTTMQEHIKNNLIYFYEEENKVPRFKRYLDTVTDEVIKSTFEDFTDGKKEIMKLFEGNTYFDNAKPTTVLTKIINITKDNDIILDFFAGSGTTAHAVMAQNAEDGGNRKFIMVQLDEETDEKSEAYKAGYKTIAELSRERIRRAGEKIVAENKDKLATRETELDIGFRAFRVDSTNMKDVYYHPKDLKQDNLLDLVDTIKADRQTEDLLIQILLDKGLTLDLPIQTQKFKQNTVYIVGDNDLIVCMDTVLDADIIDDLAQLGADTAVFRDSSFATEADRIKLETHFKRLSPRDTRIKVI